MFTTKNPIIHFLIFIVLISLAISYRKILIYDYQGVLWWFCSGYFMHVQVQLLQLAAVSLSSSCHHFHRYRWISRRRVSFPQQSVCGACWCRPLYLSPRCYRYIEITYFVCTNFILRCIYLCTCFQESKTYNHNLNPLVDCRGTWKILWRKKSLHLSINK